MEKGSAIAFVRFGESSYTSLKSIKECFIVDWVFLFFSLVAFFASGKGLIGVLLLSILSVLHICWYLLLRFKIIKNTYRLRFLANSVGIFHLSAIFYVFFMLLANISDMGASLWQNIECTIVFFLAPLIANLIFYIAVKRGKYLGENRAKNNSNGIRIPTFIGVAGGMLLSRIIFRYFKISQSQAISIIFILLELLLILFSIATSSYLKYYYAVKYDITSDLEGNTFSQELIYIPQKTSKAKKVGKILLISVIVGFLILILIGITQSKDNM